jgi:hypothetical protein
MIPVLRFRDTLSSLVSGDLRAGVRGVQSATHPVSHYDAFSEHFGEIQRVLECDFALFLSTRTSTRKTLRLHVFSSTWQSPQSC